jgi:Protein of unknown function (DUF642)
MCGLGKTLATVALLIAVQNLMGQEMDQDRAGNEQLSPSAANPNLVRNGSFENKKNTWQDTNCNYMALDAGATTIPGWTVTPATINQIVWAMTPTCDNHTAAAGTFFLDLTGFGADSPNGGVQQTLKNLTVGHEYKFSVDVITDGQPPLVTIDGATITLTAGKSFQRGSDTWTVETGTFMAQSEKSVLAIQNQASQIGFVDNVIVKAQ